MKFTPDRRIQVGFWLLTLVPLLFAFLTWRYAEQTIEAAREVSSTNELVSKLESFISRLKDVEVAQREFVLTGDETYAAEIRRARADINTRLPDLERLDVGEDWMEVLRTLVPEKFREIDNTLKLRRDGDVAGAASTLGRGENGQPMDDIRRSVRAMIDRQAQLLRERSALRNQNFTYMLAVFAVVLLLNAALIWAVFYYVRRESRNILRLNEQLEARVEQRTLELRSSNEELQQFAYVASHDMKEPMRMISSYATLLQRRYAGKIDGDADTYIQFITDGVRRMNSLITDLLDYSRAGQLTDEHKMELNPEEVLVSVLTDLQAQIEETGASVTRDPLPRIVYEPVRLSQLFQNLISNAMKYSRPDVRPAVHVSATQRDGEITFAIRDNGQGIAPEYQADIFGIFKRLHGQDVEGTGIGLATCKKIVEEHGGRIWVESEPGSGSVFCFTVPVQKQPARRRAASR